MSMPETVKIICEDSVRNSISCRLLLNGLKQFLKKNKISYVIDETVETSNTAEKIFIIGISLQWLERVVEECNFRGNIPTILSAFPEQSYKGKYNLVCPDTKKICDELILKLKNSGRNRIALYGIDYSSSADRSRVQSLEDIVGNSRDIYTNNTIIENCFRIFQKMAEEYDAVICVNGYTAVSLVKNLLKENKEILEQLVILSFEEALRNTKYSQYISYIHLKLENYGEKALLVSEIKSSLNDINNIIVKMDSVLDEISSQEYSKETDIERVPFEDPEIINMTRIERILKDADDLDHHIIAMLLSNATYDEIADTCYLTERHVRYRIRKYKDACGCKGKRELLELLKEFL